MKITLAILATLTITTNLFAFGYDTEPEIRYLSWCDDNKVMTEDSKGTPVLQKDCDKLGETCTLVKITRPTFSHFVGICEKKK